MKKIIAFSLFLPFIISCTHKNRYGADTYYNKIEQKEILSSIATYIFDAPPYTQMADRFKPEHREFYEGVSSRLSIDQYFVGEDGTNYFFVMRQAPNQGEKRGVGGYFKVGKDFKLKNFHEIFVTPIMIEKDVKTKGYFLFDKMVKGEIEEYLKMKSYVQWPNDASHYDTIKYEWTLDLVR